MINTVGWIGSIAFAVSAVPQAYKSWVEGNSEGISWGMILLCLTGEICSLIYVIPSKQFPLIVNYLGNFIFMLIILYYKINPVNEL